VSNYPLPVTSILIHPLSAFFNNNTYVEPWVPTLYTVISSGSHATNPVIYGSHTNSFVLAGNETVEIILNNNDDGVFNPCLPLDPANRHRNIPSISTVTPSKS
jgi:hypothetical protein